MGLKSFFQFEQRAIFGKWFIGIFLFTLISGGFLQNGIDHYQGLLKEKEKFQQFEKGKYEQFVYITQHSEYGIRILFTPSPLMAFFDAGPVPDNLTAFIDSSERMKIYQPVKGQTAVTSFSGGFLSLSGFLLLFGSLMFALFGYSGTKNHNWLNYLAGVMGSRKKLFFYIFVSKSLLLMLFCLILAILSYVLFMVNGIAVNMGHVAVYFLVIFGTLLIFLLIGLTVGTMKKRSVGIILLITTWFLLAFLFPTISSKWARIRAASIKSTYLMEIDKQKTFMKYERDAYEEAGPFDESKRGSEPERKMFMKFWNTGFLQVMQCEKDMLEEMKFHDVFNKNISSFTPSTFFISFSEEISSRGFLNLISFYEYSIETKKNFFWYRAENYIFSKKIKFNPFIKGDENIFNGKSRIPGNFSFGLSIMFIWLIVLFIGCWMAFNKLLDNSPGKDAKKNELGDFVIGKTTAYITKNPTMASIFCRVLKMREISYIIVPGLEDLPTVKVKDFFKFFSVSVPEGLEPFSGEYLKSIDADKKASIVMQLLVCAKFNFEFLVLDDFVVGLSDGAVEEVKEKLNILKDGRKVVYFTRSQRDALQIADRVEPIE